MVGYIIDLPCLMGFKEGVWWSTNVEDTRLRGQNGHPQFHMQSHAKFIWQSKFLKL